MKKVIRTKNFSLPQSLRMSRNLQQKFGLYSDVGVTYRCYSTGDLEIAYRLYVLDIYNRSFKSWSGLLNKYEELMKED